MSLSNLSHPYDHSHCGSNVDQSEWKTLCSPTELILEYAKKRDIPPSYVRILPEDGSLTDLFEITEGILKQCVASQAEVDQGVDETDLDMECLTTQLEDFHISETTLHMSLFYTDGHRGKIYIHCFVDAINELKLNDVAMDILNAVCDVMVITWLTNLTYEEVKRHMQTMGADVRRQIQKSNDDLAYIISHHRALHDVIYGERGTGLWVRLEVKHVMRCIFKYRLSAREQNHTNCFRDIIVEHQSQAERQRLNNLVPTTSLYEEMIPSKYLPVVELKDKGRVVNKVYRNLLTSAVKSAGRIDKQTKTAMLAYPAILMGNSVHYTKVIFPANVNVCHSVVEGYGKNCSRSFFTCYAGLVRDILNKHLHSVLVEEYMMMASRRKVAVCGMEGVQIHLLCDAVMTTEWVRDVLFIRELNRVMEQSITLFIEVKFPLEHHIASTISFRTTGGIITECTVMVKGGRDTFIHVLGYIERLFCVLKLIITNQTSEVKNGLLAIYDAFETIDVEAPIHSNLYSSRSYPIRGTRSNKPISALLERAPDLFISGYARDCQSKAQPLIINESEAKMWIGRNVLYNNASIPRTVIQMDVSRGRILMVCPNDKLPFPHFKNNVQLANKAKYPLIPCCQRTESRDIPTEHRYVIEGLSEDEEDSVDQEASVKVTTKVRVKDNALEKDEEKTNSDDDDDVYVPSDDDDLDETYVESPSPRRRKKAKCRKIRDGRFLRHKHISILPTTLSKVLDLRDDSFDISFNSTGEIPDALLQNYVSRTSKSSESGSMYSTKGGFHTHHSTALECILTAVNDVGYTKSSKKYTYVKHLRKTLSEIPNLQVLVAQEIWAVVNNREEEAMVVMQHSNIREGDECERNDSQSTGMGTNSLLSGGSSYLRERAVDQSMIMHTISEQDLRNMVRNPNIEFDMDLFFRIAEEYFKVNIYCISMLKDTIFEVPRHRFYHCRPSRLYRDCVVIYKTINTSGLMQYNLVVSNSVLASDKEARGRMPAAMSRRCHTLLINSHSVSLVKRGECYLDAMSDLDYLKHFTKDLRGVALDGAGKTDFLVLGVSDKRTGETRAICCVSCLQVQPPNTARWQGPPLRISHDLAVKVFGPPKSISHEGLVYDGYGVQSGFLVYTKQRSGSRIELPLSGSVKQAKLAAEVIWNVANMAYKLYRSSLKGGAHSWVEFEDKYVSKGASCTPSISNPLERRHATFAGEVTPELAPVRLRVDDTTCRHLLQCIVRTPEWLNVERFLSVVHSVVPNIVSNGKLVLYAEEIKCISMHAPDLRHPVGMSTDKMFTHVPDSVISFESREAVLKWCHQRDLNEITCCTMPMVHTVDAVYAKGFVSFLYCEPITETIYMIYNAGMASLESCLLTSMIWKDGSYVCPPNISQILLNKADAMGESVTFDNKYLGTLYASIMTTGCADATNQPSQDRSSALMSGRWFVDSELNPLAPANMSKVTTGEPVGDVMYEVKVPHLSNMDMVSVERVTIPTSADLKRLDHVVLVVHSEGDMEVAYVQTNGSKVCSGDSFSQTSYEYRHHLKVLIYGTLYDYTHRVPKLMASVMDI